MYNAIIAWIASTFRQNTLGMWRNMDKKDNVTREYYTIDMVHIFKSLFRRLWVIIVSSVLAAAIGFSVAAFMITPKFSSSIMLYVNNSSFSLGNTNFSISSSEITAAQSLVKTYIVILESRTTIEQVASKSGTDYSYEDLLGMIDAQAVNETEVLKVTVTTEDPEEAKKIVNCIAEVLPNRISEIIEGSSMEVVDLGVVNKQKVSPSITKYTAIAFILGAFASVVVLIILAILDDTIHDEEYVLENYDYPILAKVPDLLSSGSKSSYRYYYNSKNTTK